MPPLLVVPKATYNANHRDCGNGRKHNRCWQTLVGIDRDDGDDRNDCQVRPLEFGQMADHGGRPACRLVGIDVCEFFEKRLEFVLWFHLLFSEAFAASEDAERTHT